MTAEVFLQIGEGPVRELQAEDFRLGKQRAQAQGHRPGPGAQVQPPGARPLPQPPGQLLHQDSCVLPGAEHPLAHCQGQAHKLPFPQDVLQGPPGSPFLHRLEKGGLPLGRGRLFPVKGQAGPVQAQKALGQGGGVRAGGIHPGPSQAAPGQ